ncbi:MAG TPA: Holliday junction resolvase RuvX [Ktedonobacteraceae bacterium]|jgi:putative Holliday junction resolvase|nr:Holliday junction resolvase RuvX [Ktedonobacteraceae bacterium]
MARLLALDVGEARIGVAISDATEFLASPYTTLHVSRNESQTWETIRQIISETDAEGLVVGLPVSLDGQLHSQARRVQAFAERLKAHISIPITFWDERFSTVEVERLLAERGQVEAGRHSDGSRGRRPGSGRSRKRKRGNAEVDALAATIILQEYLDHRSKKTEDESL